MQLQNTTSVMMSTEEARDCVSAIQDSLIRVGKEAITIRQQYLALYEGEGWKALGYESWRACVEAEFKQGQTRVYALLTEAKIERQLAISSPAGKVSPGAVRELAKKPAKEREAIIERLADEPVITPTLVRRNWNAIPAGVPVSKEKQALTTPFRKDSVVKARHECPYCRC